MRYNFKKFLIIFFFLIFLPLLIKAIEFNPPWQTKSFQELLDAIYNFIFWVAIAIVPIMVIVAAYFFLTSGGDPEKIRTAKKIIFWTFIGLIIVLLGKGVVAIIGQLLGGGPSGGPGPGPSCGNGSLDPGEECDPPQDAACPGRCQADCTCRGLTATKLLMLGDVNKDCKIDGADIGKISHDIGAKPGDPNWSPDEDLNGNGVIDDCDEMIAANSFGLKCGDLLNATKLLMLGDVNKDCKIDVADISKISHDIGAKPGDPNWSPDEDLNGNGVIDDCDEMIAANSFGLSCD